MESRLDVEYERQRRALIEHTVTAVTLAWHSRDLKDRSNFLDTGMTLVDGAAEAYVTLQSAYFNAKASAAHGTEVNHEINASIFHSETIRPDEPKFLNQAYGTLIWKMEHGKDFETANEEAAQYIQTLIKTHLQAIQVRAAWLWMATF